MKATVSASAVVHASPARVYNVIADYRQHHPRIVPPEYFTRLEVLEGGVGAGTRTQVEMRVLGVTRRFVHVIEEPEPGRVLQEGDLEGHSVTTFIVDATEDGAAAHVTIQTSFEVRPGLVGSVERALTTWTLQRIYPKELARLERYAASLGSAP